jgi:diguanylate cyclase (GGDEF)-like protein
MIDLDNFKDVNDRYGHLIGDVVIVEAAQVIRSVIFERDIFCRYGGDEFVVLFTGTTRQGALVAIEKILNTVEHHEFTGNRTVPAFPLTVSIGFASYNEETNICRLLDLADRRVYDAKMKGKNMVVGE